MKKLFLSIAIVATLLLGVVGGVWATSTFNKVVPATVHINSASPDLGIFSDSACTQPLNPIAFGDVTGGETKQITVYIKNVGNKAFSSVTISTDLSSTAGTVTGTAGPLAKGASSVVLLNFNADPAAVTADPSFNITFACVN